MGAQRRPPAAQTPEHGHVPANLDPKGRVGGRGRRRPQTQPGPAREACLRPPCVGRGRVRLSPHGLAGRRVLGADTQVPGAEGAATSPVHCSPSRDGPLLPPRSAGPWNQPDRPARRGGGAGGAGRPLRGAGVRGYATPSGVTTQAGQVEPGAPCPAPGWPTVGTQPHPGPSRGRAAGPCGLGIAVHSLSRRKPCGRPAVTP